MQHLYYARKAAMMLEASTLMCPNTHGRAIICGVREPIAWALSLYFEGFSYLMGDNYESITVEKVADFVIKVLGNEMCDLGPSYLSPERWLTDEFSPAHNFNPLGHDFDIGTGYRVYETGKTPILMIRQESLSSLPQALSLLLSHPAEFISPVNENIAEAKVYSGIYRTIRDRLKFDSAFLHSVYSGAYSRKFYSEAECESFKRRWKS